MCSKYAGVCFKQVKFTKKISNIWTLFLVWFIQDSVFFRVRFKQISLYIFFCICNKYTMINNSLTKKRRKKRRLDNIEDKLENVVISRDDHYINVRF